MKRQRKRANAPKNVGSGTLSRMMDSQKRQAREFVADLLRMRGLMPLLM